MGGRQTTLIKGARVLRPGASTVRPAVADILVEGDTIAAVAPGIDRPADRVIDASDRLAVPGFVNAHYHSHDVLLKGCFEAIPREAWLLNALPPNYPRRPKAEVRARTILGAVECLKGGITTVQDMLALDLAHSDDLASVLDAYDEVGIRCVLAIQTGDVHGAAVTPFWSELMPKDAMPGLGGVVAGGAGTEAILRRLGEVLEQYQGRHRAISWGLGPSSPERSSPDLLHGLRDLGERHAVRTFMHVYESRATTVIGRQKFGDWGGSLIGYLDAHGMLGRHVTLAHGVWMRAAEIERIAARGSAVVLNPVGNMKTRSGIPPILQYIEGGVRLGLGCDNCSCSDAQNMFQVMKAYAGLAAVSSPDFEGPTAADALAAATVGGADALGLGGTTGEIHAGMKADLSLLDLGEPAFVPLNGAARQLVFTATGREVDTVLVDGRVVVEGRRMVTVDEAALRVEVETAMESLSADIDRVVARNGTLRPYLEEAHRLTWHHPLEISRYLPDLTEAP